MRAELMRRVQSIRGLLAAAGPYLLIEILLPGGTLIALLLFLYQRNQVGAGIEGSPPFAALYMWAIGRLRDLFNRLQTSAARPATRPAERDGLEPLAMSPMH